MKPVAACLRAEILMTRSEHCPLGSKQPFLLSPHSPGLIHFRLPALPTPTGREILVSLHLIAMSLPLYFILFYLFIFDRQEIDLLR